MDKLQEVIDICKAKQYDVDRVFFVPAQRPTYRVYLNTRKGITLKPLRVGLKVRPSFQWVLVMMADCLSWCNGVINLTLRGFGRIMRAVHFLTSVRKMPAPPYTPFGGRFAL